MNGAKHADIRDISIRFVLYTECEHVLFPVYNVFVPMNQTLDAPDDLDDARPNALAFANEALTAISGSETPSVAANES